MSHFLWLPVMFPDVWEQSFPGARARVLQYPAEAPRSNSSSSFPLTVKDLLLSGTPDHVSYSCHCVAILCCIYQQKNPAECFISTLIVYTDRIGHFLNHLSTNAVLHVSMDFNWPHKCVFGAMSESWRTHWEPTQTREEPDQRKK